MDKRPTLALREDRMRLAEIALRNAVALKPVSGEETIIIATAFHEWLLDRVLGPAPAP